MKWVYVLELRAKRAQEKATEIYVPTSITVHRKTANALQVKSEPLQIKDVLVDKIR
ncbi:hypothetical protein [Gracilibacillus boraciitolerans]|uniref:hypothetical protein n=1 Tax=Gracilibacillus boraciitolerans TaxID=307521 RepID=UPI001F466771|nr:hypothetical protein [Gracilibacillus boraciitolerans]